MKEITKMEKMKTLSGRKNSSRICIRRLCRKTVNFCFVLFFFFGNTHTRLCIN